MICKIAELITEIPESGGLASRCKTYLWEKEESADVIIRTDFYQPEKYPENMSAHDVAYMESARQFYGRLVSFNGLFLHSSAVELDEKAYLFSGPSGTGKSTHTQLWQKIFGDKAQVFNDDKPALRLMQETWFAYGTPWCGKDGINQNKKVPLAGICFLKQSSENKIRRLSPQEALTRILSQTIYHFQREERLDLLLGLVEKLVKQIPIFELENRPEPEAAKMSYETMSCAAKECGL